jgi:hypothetical protein
MECTPSTSTGSVAQSSMITIIVATMLAKFGSDALRVAETQVELATGPALSRWAAIAAELRRQSARP